MKFLTDILAKAGLTVDGVVTLNNTATGQTPAANDNSTKLATTAWVQSYVVPYTLPIASASVLGGIKVGSGLSIDAGSGVLSALGAGNLASFRTEQVFTATAGQTTFTISGGYATGFIDIFVNGVYLNEDQYTATNNSTIVLTDAASLNDVVTAFVWSPYYVGNTPSARNVCAFTATAGQTTFSCTYVIGEIDVYYNGSKLATSEYTATNGTSIILGTACAVGDQVEVISWYAGGGVPSNRTLTINGISYDLSANRTWTLTTSNISEGTNLYYTDARARAAITLTTTGVSGAATYDSSTGALNIPNYQGLVPAGGNAGDILAKASATNYDTTWIANYTSQVQHYVKLAEAMTIGTAVYVSGSTGVSGTNMLVSKASNASEATSSKTMGLLASGGAQNDIVFVVTEGLVSGIDTSTAQAGDPVWLGVNGALIFGLANKPYAPAHLVFIGIVTRVQQNNGEIFVKVQNGFELQELHNVQITTTPADNTVLSYETSSSLYKMKSIATLLGYTPANDSLVVHLAGTETITGDKTITGSLTITSTTKAFVPPRMTATERAAISSPTVGSIVYQTDGNEGLWAYTSSGWKALALVN